MGAAIGAVLGGPVGAVIGGIADYLFGKKRHAWNGRLCPKVSEPSVCVRMPTAAE